MTFEDMFMNSNSQNNIETTLPLFTELAINFDTGEVLIGENGDVIKLEKNEALKVWIWKALKTKRNKFDAYSSSFGTDLYNEIGYVYDRTIKQQLINNEIYEALKVNPYIVNVYEFNNIYDNENLRLTVQFKVDTIYGVIEENEVKNIEI